MTVVVDAKSLTAYSTHTEAVFMMDKSVKTKAPKVDEGKENAYRDGKLVMWGQNNQFPQEVLKDARKNTIIGTIIDQKARIAFEG